MLPIKNILIYGANSTVAQEFIFSTDPKEYYYYLFSRSNIKNEDLLRSKGYHIKCFQGDISNKDDINLFLEMCFTNNPIDILINCAAVMHIGYLNKIPHEKLTEMLEVNIIGLVNTYQLTSKFLNKDKAKLVYLGSIAGNKAHPGGVVYCASKAFLNSFIKGIKNETEYLNGNLNIHIISPGPIRTKFTTIEKTPQNLKLLEPSDISNQINSVINTNISFSEVSIYP